MPEYITITEKIERRTYFRGHLQTKLVGLLDQPNSDLKIENFYDLEILEALLQVNRQNFRLWHEGDEFEEFLDVEKFITRLPTPLPSVVIDEKGHVEYYNLQVFEPKLANYKLFNQVYEKEKIFVTLEGEISGYLRHYDTEEKQIEVIEDSLPATPDSEVETVFSQSSVTTGAAGRSGSFDFENIPNHRQISNNKGCAPELGCSATSGGCISLFTIVIFAFIAFGLLIGAVTNLLNYTNRATSSTLSFLASFIFPLFFIGTIFYFFVRFQSRLSFFWRLIFRIIIILLIFLMWFT